MKKFGPAKVIWKETAEAVRELSPIDKVIAEQVRLRRVGVQFVGRCPFHADKTPSFSVHPGKQVFHCHGCQAGGDVFDFVQRLHGFSFFGSVHFLAERAGIRLDGFEASPELTARVAAARVHREEEVDFQRFCSERIKAVNQRNRELSRAATHAEKCLCAGESDPYVQNLAWDALERFRTYEASIEREGLVDINVLRTEWEAAQQGGHHVAA